MRILFGALSFAAGVVLLFLFAKLLIAGLLFALGLAAFAFFVHKLRLARYGYAQADHYGDFAGDHQAYRYPAVHTHAGWQDNGSFRFQTITVQ
jgi:hypothetical protein